MATKPNKSDRINAFILGGAQQRATEQVRAYIAKNVFGINKLDDEAFKAAMDKIYLALMQMYSTAMCDTLDVVNGKPLEEIK